jgi:hypothetical protein
MSESNVTKLMLDVSDERWAAFVHAMPDATIFHHPAWINLLAECYGYRPFVVALCNERGEITAALPMIEINSSLTGRRWVCLPFTDHCNPLRRGDTPLGELFAYLRELQITRGVPHVEIRSAIPYDDGPLYEDHSQVVHTLKLSADAQATYRNFHRTKVKQCIAKAEREGVRVRWADSRRDLYAFYDLHLGTRHRLGVPIQPRRYFELLWERIIDTGLGFILLAYKDSVPVAGVVLLAYNSVLMEKHGASDRDYWNMRPNHLLLWTSIRWGCEHGYSVFDFGKTQIENAGLRSFKNGWGTEESILTYSVLADAPPGHATDRLSGLTRTVIRRAPRWVCRMTGELLYGHFA